MLKKETPRANSRPGSGKWLPELVARCAISLAIAHSLLAQLFLVKASLPLGGNRGESGSSRPIPKTPAGVVSSCSEAHLSRLQRMLVGRRPPRKRRRTDLNLPLFFCSINSPVSRQRLVPMASSSSRPAALEAHGLGAVTWPSAHVAMMCKACAGFSMVSSRWPMRPTQKALEQQIRIFGSSLPVFCARQAPNSIRHSVTLEPGALRRTSACAIKPFRRDVRYIAGNGRAALSRSIWAIERPGSRSTSAFQEVTGLLVAGKDQDFAESLDIDHPAGPAIEHDPPIPKSCIAAEAHPIGQTLDGLENWRSRASARDFLIR